LPLSIESAPAPVPQIGCIRLLKIQYALVSVNASG
jgi:hypothetical protein